MEVSENLDGFFFFFFLGVKSLTQCQLRKQSKQKKHTEVAALWFWVDKQVLFYCSNRVKESGLWLISEAEN